MAKEYKVVVTEAGNRRFILELDSDRRDYVEVWMRNSKENGGLEGYYITVYWSLSNNKLHWTKNVFGRGLYAKDMAEKHFLAVCNCVIDGYEICRKKIRLANSLREYLCNELANIRVEVNQETERVEGDPICFETLLGFENKWGGDSKVRKVIYR